ncbi:MAG: zinc-dependent metalloprotease, partial [Flaviaesturariibacter sp.]|nr:zinc-dependent metalloprotease [Flaviaesturariibacter sp.]
QTQMFKKPMWLVEKKVTNYTGYNSLTTINGIQDNILGRLISANTIGKLLRFEAEGTNPYTANEMLTDLKKGIWSELTAKSTIDIYRRNLQKAHVERLIRLANPEPATAAITLAGFGGGAAPVNRNNDAISLAKMQLRSLQSEIRAAMPTYKDASSRAHLMDVNDRITAALDPTK